MTLGPDRLRLFSEPVENYVNNLWKTFHTEAMERIHMDSGSSYAQVIHRFIHLTFCVRFLTEVST
jgi:hypothetical protein